MSSEGPVLAGDIESHRLAALVPEDLQHYPDSAISDNPNLSGIIDHLRQAVSRSLSSEPHSGTL